MDTNQTITEKINNNKIGWDNYYKTYQKNTNIPGIKYPNQHLTRFISILAKEYGKNHKRKILELGFGNITNMSMMQSYGFKVLGLEVSREAIERAKKAITASKLEKNLSVGLFEGNKLPVEDNSFDVITGLECVYYNIDQEIFSKECHRVLKPGGKIFFSLFSPRHGYMNYIHGEPGSIVKFAENHPNPRLVGLELFLFKSKRQLEDTYGKYFDVAIGMEEYDTYPLFMSYYYLFGQKKNSKSVFSNCLSLPTINNTMDSNKKNIIKIEEIEKNNTKLWDHKYKLLYKDKSNLEQRYPYEPFVRFLATRNRGKLDKFYRNIGNEEEAREKNGKVLELMPENIANLLMISKMNYLAYGLSTSELMLERLKQETVKIKKTKSILFNEMKNYEFPYENRTFDFVISSDMGSYIPDQEQLVKETARVLSNSGETFIGYLTPRHGYLQWAEASGENYYTITSACPDPALHGMTIYVADKEKLNALWKKSFEAVEINTIEYDFFSIFSSLYFVRAEKERI
ncbi:MAG: class I SAM-dependent methyltransferase [Candidatus Omnitrophica bacterium]|nr:class I SAM-dependent methyltransferase [Candidatus Omnitrophota bacterium]MDD5352388.1 class I SAM-dependent methyltransferase [Candidatus Omnitrophota bacterium]MDD5549986.1 class I SAM-dependent methyltransferase [Candidatus Omnitrophota bacterium]